MVSPTFASTVDSPLYGNCQEVISIFFALKLLEFFLEMTAEVEPKYV